MIARSAKNMAGTVRAVGTRVKYDTNTVLLLYDRPPFRVCPHVLFMLVVFSRAVVVVPGLR